MGYEAEELRIVSGILLRLAQELRQPLNNMALSLCDTEDGDVRTNRRNAVIRQSYYKMLRLASHLDMVPELLDGERLPKQNTEVVSWCRELCMQAEDLCRERGVVLTMQCSAPSHVTAICREQTERLFWNLISNALKFTEPGGTITVTLKTAGKMLLLSVADSGRGISQERMESVFCRWLETERMDPVVHGLGLGLPLCRSIAERQGGRLLLDSREGEGTTVSVALPDEITEQQEVYDVQRDYSGGFSLSLLEMSDALPSSVFIPE